ncbi:DUF2851 domain-containing protein [Taibaiella sp. KBW10]|uniref:DUF2851 family protein n=1 Tax=Taibaiella sp. KBW10 TaxID=2153357 RepID=UPI000F5A0466|nr:DUF2851 family protein [Taibaiella sp. KBW10]RQO31200.1 DUF2851 domain-containing protein [Taibaiella sp. KBW10]
MNEKLFQFIWQYALFNPQNLCLKDGRGITIIHRGQHNPDAGPDFIGAKLLIENTTWIGNIELHLKESDWLKHQHHKDTNYHNIILHVVLEEDVSYSLGNFPVLSLKGKIKQTLITYYEQLMLQQQTIACNTATQQVPELLRNHWLDRLLVERWEEKSAAMEALLVKSNYDWRGLLYHRIAYNLGTKANAAAFAQLALQTPLNILSKHRTELSHIEAILFGQAGLIPEVPQDPYAIELTIHYAFYKQKYQLQAVPKHIWKFSRMRPAHFPTIRLAQLAMLLHKSHDLFSKMITAKDNLEIEALLYTEVSTYWQDHYTFEKPAKRTQKHMGKSMIQNIIINTIAPIQYLYAAHTDNLHQKEKALQLLHGTPPEENHILDKWAALNITPQNAVQSQALIQLYNHYCSKKQCLRCSIGHYLLKQ